MDSKVAYKCTVFDGDGEKLFQMEGTEKIALALTVAKGVVEAWHPKDVEELTWQFEKVYPERLEHKPPPSEVMLESWDNYVATMRGQLKA